MSQLYNGTQDFSPAVLEAASAALQVEPHELLMHPTKAMAIRQLRSTAATIVEFDSDDGQGTHLRAAG